MSIYIGGDHAGFKLKEKLKKWLEKEGQEVEDLGALELNPDDDYPDFAKKVARKTVENKGMGILVCGTGQGACVAANKVKGVRGVVVVSEEEAKLSREHNDANVLCLSGWHPPSEVKDIVRVWLRTPFSGEERHKRRLKKIEEIEND